MSEVQIIDAPPAVPNLDLGGPTPGTDWLALAHSVALPVSFTAGILAMWEIYVRATSVPTVILPAPSVILTTIVQIYPILFQHTLPTTLESAAGFVISCVLGIGLAILIAYSGLIRKAVYPNLIFAQVIPKIALAPLFIVWFGLGSESRLAFSVFISIFPIIVSTYTGLTNVDPNLLRLCSSLGAREWQVFLSVRFPSALPFIFSGMKVSITLAIIGVVIGEFITSQRGLGYLIVNLSARADTPSAMAAVVFLCISGLILFGAVALLQIVVNKKYGQPGRS
jgi:NitT/TauT family transport system permease protein